MVSTVSAGAVVFAAVFLTGSSAGFSTGFSAAFSVGFSTAFSAAFLVVALAAVFLVVVFLAAAALVTDVFPDVVFLAVPAVFSAAVWHRVAAL